MTNNLKAERPLTADPLPCPFCGASLVMTERKIWVHPWNDQCPADVIRINTTKIEAWNTRQSLSTQQPMGEVAAYEVRHPSEPDEVHVQRNPLTDRQLSAGCYSRPLYALNPNQESGE